MSKIKSPESALMIEPEQASKMINVIGSEVTEPKRPLTPLVLDASYVPKVLLILIVWVPSQLL